jgi:hypothetical protein
MHTKNNNSSNSENETKEDHSDTTTTDSTPDSRMTTRSGSCTTEELAYVNALSDEFDNRKLGIKPGTHKITFFVWAVNRSKNSMDFIWRNYLTHIKRRQFTGYVRDPCVAERLQVHRLKLGAYIMPSVDELLAHFMPGHHVVQTLLLKPTSFLAIKTEPIPVLHRPPKGIIAMSNARVSTETQAKCNESLDDQCKVFACHGFTHHPDMIPRQGMTCFLETCSAYTKVPEALLVLLNDPILSRLDADGDCIACNTWYVKCVERVMKQVGPFIEIRDALSLRNINIWSIDEKCGSRSHPDKFLELIKAGNTLGVNQSNRMHLSRVSKGLRNCTEHPPSRVGDSWCTAEDDRLREFLDISNVQDKYLNVQKSCTKIKWKVLADEFPYRTGLELRNRFISIRKLSH